MMSQQKKDKIKRGVLEGAVNGIAVAVCTWFCTTPVFASTNIGENVGTWVLEQLGWAFLVGTLFGAGMLFLKRNWWAAAITIVVGGFLTFLTADPARVRAFGEALGTLILG